MKLANGLMNLSPSQLMKLIGTFIQQPLYLIPTYKATRKTLDLCNKKFGAKHHEDNRTNAFRHALWNFMICRKCYKISKSVEKALYWSKKVTDLHEKLLPNEELSTLMDLHNNRLGRDFFRKFPNIEIDKAIEALELKMKEAEKVSIIADLKNKGNQMVFIDKLNVGK